MEGLSGSGKTVFSVKKEKIPGEETGRSMNFLTARPTNTCRIATATATATFCHFLSRYQTLPIIFHFGSDSSTTRYTWTGSAMFSTLCPPRD